MALLYIGKAIFQPRIIRVIEKTRFWNSLQQPKSIHFMNIDVTGLV